MPPCPPSPWLQGTKVPWPVPAPWPTLPMATPAQIPHAPKRVARTQGWHQPGASGQGELLALASGCSGFGAPWLPPKPSALEPPPVPRSWWLVWWHHGCPNPRPAPCGGFIAGMNTVICRGRAAQLWGGGGHFGDPGWGGRSSRQHLSHCPPHSLLTAGRCRHCCRHPGLPNRVVPWERSHPPCSSQRHSVPPPEGGAHLAPSAAAPQKLVPDPAAPPGPFAPRQAP